MLSTSTADVGFPSQPNSDGTLRITPPSTLSVATLNVARSQRTIIGRVFIDGAAMTVTQNANIGEAGQGSLEITDGGLFDAGQLIIGGANSGFNAAQGSVDIAGLGSKLVARNRIAVGEFGTGELRVADGALLQSGFLTTSAQATIGNGFGSQGTATVAGPDTAWEHNGTLTVGGQGSGLLYILEGAHVTSLMAALGGPTGEPNGVGTAVIDGAGSRWTTDSLTIGDRTIGEILVTNGGLLDVSNNSKPPTVLGRQTNSFGRLVVSGPTSRWLDSQVVVGQSGAGEIIIDDGALVTSGIVTLGQSPGEGLARISGPTTRWQINNLTVGGGSTGRGTLEITDGASVVLSTAAQQLVGAAGRIVLDNGRLTSTANATVQNSGVVEGSGVITGRFTNNSTGQLRVGQGDYLRIAGSEINQQGRLQVFGGEFEWSDNMTNGSSGIVTADNATLRSRGATGLNNIGLVQLTGGANRVFGNVTNNGTMAVTGGQATFYDRLTNSGLMSASAGTTVTVLGAMNGNGIQGAGTVHLEGPVSPGASPGVMEFGADVHLGATSRLNIEIAGNTPGDGFDQLSADGTVFLGGALHLEALGELGANATLPIVSAGDILGTFNSVPEIGTHLGFGVRFNGITYDYNHGEVRVSLLQGMAADFDVNGSVDGSDFLLWQQSAGAAVAHAGTGADYNGDGLVNDADLAMWAASGAAVAAQEAAQTTVPEPSALALLIVGCLGVRLRVGGAGRRF